MSQFINLLLSLLAAYLVGSIPTSYIFAKVLKGIDIRQYGSQNVGATNVARTVGKVPALIVLILDIAKGVVVVTFLARFFYEWTGDIDFILYRTLMALAVICGHIWTVFLKFKGGKGIATAIGVMLVITPKAMLSSGVIWIAVFAVTGYVSLSSIVMMLTCPIFTAVIGEPISVVIFSILVCFIAIYRHKSNISRLLKGTESKILKRLLK